MFRKGFFRSEKGNILIMSVVLTALILATGLAYMKWATAEKWDSEYERATVQAYFIAQTGLIKEGLKYLRTRQPTDLPQGTVILTPGPATNIRDRDWGDYHSVYVRRVVTVGEQNVFQRSDTYDIYSTGRVYFQGQNRGLWLKPWRRYTNNRAVVNRTATLRARLRSFSNYMYLSDKEPTIYGETIWFWTPDTLWGRVHSNDYIGLKYSPVFYGPVSTSKERFIYYQPGNIYFAYPPIFNAPIVQFPRTANNLRNNSLHISDRNGRMMTWIKFKGAQGIDIYQYPLGSAPRESLIMSLGVPNWSGIFVEGQAEIEGIVAGTVTVGTAGDMWLVDDVKYLGSDSRTGWFGSPPNRGDVTEGGMPHMLGLVSERNIIIKNTWRNGRENGWYAAPGDFNRHSIAINAAMVALGESFTFQHQNDDWEPYQGPTPDERGWINLKGCVIQARRGYVHRSNHQGTGYDKRYFYDFRLDRRPPPYFLEAMDQYGHGLFDILSWGEQRPRR